MQRLASSLAKALVLSDDVEGERIVLQQDIDREPLGAGLELTREMLEKMPRQGFSEGGWEASARAPKTLSS
ncbi:MAG: hypothetical protein DRQ55_04630 [Planctomycetota bacterium]|nr:MAG: hypothetical protein DRQ55_04630 [Planctomycetota bacterium]